jgi:REP element-mobilizing transposase RayT
MARSIRIQYAGALYHVMARGNRRELIFRDDDDRRFFLKTVAEVCEMTGWRIHAWLLMSNHYHLLIQTPEANLVAGMKWLQNTYTRRFNIRHRLWGRLFGDRYKAMPVEGGGYYYETLLDYIHLNPVRAKLVKARSGQSVLDYPWSSVAGGCALPPGRRPRWLAAGDALGAFACADTARGRRKWVERLDRLASQGETENCGVALPPAEADGRCSHLRRGWYWGSQGFAERMLKLGESVLQVKRHRNYRASPESRAHCEREALRLLKSGLEAGGLKAAELGNLKGSDPRKVAIARVIRQQTTVSMGWLAERLSMRSAANVSQQIRRKPSVEKTLPRPLKT